MAKSLRERLRLSGGQLAETSAEELANLTGRSQAPIQPLETAVIGGNPDVSKMAGTQAQRTAALRNALRPQDSAEQDSLATRLRRQDVRRTATAGEQERIEQAERLGQLGSLESRVDQLAEQAIAQTQPPDIPLQLADPESDIGQLVNRIQQNPQDQAAVLELNQKLGNDARTPLTAQELMTQLGQDQGAQIGQALAGSVQDAITAGSLNLEEMGFSGGAEEVAELLGTDTAALQGMSMQQLVDTVNTQIQQEFSQVDELQRRASDPALGASERAEARAQLRELGAVGIRAAESDVDQLADEIAQANEVEFMGETLTTEQLLDNDFVSGLVKRYFDEPDFASQLNDAEPELVQFIKRHEGMLRQASEDVDESLAEFSALQQANLDLAKTPAGEFSEDIMRAWYPEYGELSTEKLEKNVVLQAFDDPTVTDGQKVALKQAVDLIQQKGGPEMVAELGNSGLSVRQLGQLGLLDNNSTQFQELSSYLDTADRVQKLVPEDAQQTARLLGASDTLELEKFIAEAQKKQASGLLGESTELRDLMSILPDGDPRTWAQEDWEDVAVNLQSRYLKDGEKLSLSDILTEGTPLDYPGLVRGTKKFSESSNDLYDLVEPAITSTGELQTDVLIDEIDQFDIEDMELINRSPEIMSRATPALQRTMRGRVEELWDPALHDISRSVGFDDGHDVNAAFESEQNVVNASNFRNMANQTSALLEGLRTQSRQARSRGDKLLERVIDDRISDWSRKFEDLQERRDDYLAEKRAEPGRIRDLLAPISKGQADLSGMGELPEDVKEAAREGLSQEEIEKGQAVERRLQSRQLRAPGSLGALLDGEN